MNPRGEIKKHPLSSFREPFQNVHPTYLIDSLMHCVLIYKELSMLPQDSLIIQRIHLFLRLQILVYMQRYDHNYVGC